MSLKCVVSFITSDISLAWFVTCDLCVTSKKKVKRTILLQSVGGVLISLSMSLVQDLNHYTTEPSDSCVLYNVTVYN